MSIILVHEMGHLLLAKHYKWKTDKIYIYPLGGITKFNEDINKPLKEEFLIVLAGPIFQIIYYFLLNISGISDTFLFNILLLSFNLLPIYPLDGGKLVNIILCWLTSYRKSFKIVINISFIVYILLFLYVFFIYKSIFFIIVIFFLIFKIIEEKNKINYYFNKFLLERYLNTYNFKKIKKIYNITNMYKDKRHLFLVNNKVITEKQMLEKYFKKY